METLSRVASSSLLVGALMAATSTASAVSPSVAARVGTPQSDITLTAQWPAREQAAPPSGAAPDGAALYGQYCSSCHGPRKKGSSIASIQSAIDSDKGGMGSLKSLTPLQVAAIAAAK